MHTIRGSSVIVLLRWVFYRHCIYFYSASAFLSTSQLRYIVGNFWSCIFFVERKYFSRIMVHRFQNKSKILTPRQNCHICNNCKSRKTVLHFESQLCYLSHFDDCKFNMPTHKKPYGKKSDKHFDVIFCCITNSF